MSSILEIRGALAAALDGVPGVNGYAYAPRAYKPGDAWSQWGGCEPPEAGPYPANFVHLWRVLIILPSDERAADEWTDEHLSDLVDALRPILSVTDVGDARLPADGATPAYRALLITGETE